MNAPEPDLECYGASKNLYVMLHGYGGTPRYLDPAKAAIRSSDRDGDFYAPSLPIGTLSLKDPLAIVLALRASLDRLWAGRQARDDRQPYRSIVFVGHSIGALIARKVYVYACGEQQEAPFEPQVKDRAMRPWAAHVERIVLLAAMNRGWSISHHMNFGRLGAWMLGSLLGSVLSWFPRGTPLIFGFRRGAPFITQLRVQWLAMRQRSMSGLSDDGGALVVQLLGSVDDLVGPHDSIDMVTGRDFVYLEVPFSGHRNVLDMDDSPQGALRTRVFRDAVFESPIDLAMDQVAYGDAPTPEPNYDVTHVVFVIHGIRDLGYWTQKIARRVILEANRRGIGRTASYEPAIRTETATYGYFPMLPFILPWKRREKVEWLMDRFTENRARYPRARFSYVGHSNGTYMLARALLDYPACKFKNVVFAGSVVHPKYAWDKIIARQQVERVLNYVATDDFVVALLPKAVDWWPALDLGGAGHDGFRARSPGIQQVRYIVGEHSAALDERNWDLIAGFILGDWPASELPAITAAKRQSWLVLLGATRLGPWLLLSLIVALGGLIGCLLNFDARLQTAGLGVYLLLIYNILTKV